MFISVPACIMLTLYSSFMCKLTTVQTERYNIATYVKFCGVRFPQGVVTLLRPVEPYSFATRIKINQGMDMSICTKSSDQGTFQSGDKAAHRRVRLSKTNTYKVSC